MKALLFTLALTIMTATGAALAEPDASFPDISKKDLQAAIHAHKVALIDCNGTKRYQKSHIPGAIDFEANKDRLGKLLPSDKKTMVVAYCGGPKCTKYRTGAQEAAGLGYLNIRHFSAGISGW